MRKLARICLMFLLFLFTFILNVNTVFALDLYLDNNDSNIQCVLCENNNADGYVAIASKRDGDGFLPESDSQESSDSHIKESFPIKHVAEKTSVNTFSLLFRTTIFPQAP